MANRYSHCGRTEKQHGGIACIAPRGAWVGQMDAPEARTQKGHNPLSRNLQSKGVLKRSISSSSTSTVGFEITSIPEVSARFVAGANGITDRRIPLDHTPMGAYQRSLPAPEILDEDKGPLGAD